VLIFVSLTVGYFAVSGSFLKSDRPAFAAPIIGISVPAVTGNASFVNTTVVRSAAMPLTKRPDPVRQEQDQPELQAFAAAQLSPTPTQAIAETLEDPLARQAVVAEATPVILPLYQVWDAQDGDSVYSIAERFGILPDYILANNVELAATDFIAIGQSIIIPAGNGVLHDIKFGETLSDIGARYDVPVEDIVDFSANGILDPDSVVETQTVFVPNATILPAAPFDEIPADESGTDGGVTDDGSGAAIPDDPGIVGGGPSSSSGLIWPISGPISSFYGPSHPLGIDIDGFNLVGSAIGAATEGTVVFAGGNGCCSYGLYVVVVSPGGIETLYAHLNSIYVTQGEYVSQGQALGVIGNSGYSTGVHLHFEVIDNGVRQNPLNYLP
jgi:murein DD-endopeptidase MepM/ murein hydrolase activator NlpD